MGSSAQSRNVQTQESSPVRSSSPTIRQCSGSQDSGSAQSSATQAGRAVTAVRTGRDTESVVRTQRAVGALMGVSRRAIERVGLLDEDLFAYAEDVDLALRVRDAGLEVVFAPAARAWHSVSASTGGEAATTHAVYYGVRNTIVVLERNRPLGSLGNALRRGSVLTTYLLLALTRDDCRAALAAVREGFRDACAGNLGPRADQRGTRSGAPASSLR